MLAPATAADAGGRLPSRTSAHRIGSGQPQVSRMQLKGLLTGRDIERCQYMADVFHQFSHISQTYGLYRVAVSACENAEDDAVSLPDHYQGFRWLNARQIAEAAISTAMKKVFRSFTQNADGSSSSSLKRKANSKETGTVSKKQMTLQSYFKSSQTE